MNTTPFPTGQETPTHQDDARWERFKTWRDGDYKRGGVMARHGYNAGWADCLAYLRQHPEELQ